MRYFQKESFPALVIREAGRTRVRAPRGYFEPLDLTARELQELQKPESFQLSQEGHWALVLRTKECQGRQRETKALEVGVAWWGW